ncbi:unnamed protein product [Rhizoctonia solani]|uniref:Laminin domain protein n=1 Tax=Rhizoctonia solani TaxID=456999 RepID=A0A8H3BQL6_9AGAM|nr:unnamed protein product [Rhizoctonia solani]
MVSYSGWYPPGQFCSPPELPDYLKNVYDLKPIVGVPSDAELIGIHAVVHTARKASETVFDKVPGMGNPGLIMELADHLFSAQMARYRNKYSLITFPSDATYTPPTLPTHISDLQPIVGAPSDGEIIKVQETIQMYQDMRRFPSMFDAHVNMELSQHLFDIQMARHMRTAGESQPSVIPQTSNIPEGPVHVGHTVGETCTATNNAGTGANVVELHRTAGLIYGADLGELMERSDQLSERLNLLFQRSDELSKRSIKTDNQSSIEDERFNRFLERLSQLLEQVHKPTEQSNCLTERFNQLFEQFNWLIERSIQPAQRANELAEQSNQLAKQLHQSSERSNQITEQSIKPVEKLGNLLNNINGVLIEIQHIIMKSRKDNTPGAVDCLVNEKGETPTANESALTYPRSLRGLEKPQMVIESIQ